MNAPLRPSNLPPAPSRVPAWKRIWSDHETDPKLTKVGPAARGAYGVILAGADRVGLYRNQGTSSAVEILASRLGTSVAETERLVGLLVREGLVALAPDGIALPLETFLRRQPELDPTRAPSTPPPAPVSEPEEPADATPPAARPAGRSVAPRRVAPAAPQVMGVKRGRPRKSVAPMSPTERRDRFHFAGGTRAFIERPEGMTFERWLEGTEAGRAWLNHRRAEDPGYALGVAPASRNEKRNENGNENAPEVFVPRSSLPHTPSLLPENKGNERTNNAPASGNENGNETPGTKIPEGDGATFVPRDDEPAPPPRALPAPDAMREHRRSASSVARRFVDACNEPDVVDGMPVAREVVMEFGRWSNPTRDMPVLGNALIDAGVLPGSSLFKDIVAALRDQETFRAIYADRKSVVATCKIEVHDLIRQYSFGLTQAINYILAQRGETLRLIPQPPARHAPSRAREAARDKQAGGLRPDQFAPNTDGETTVRRVKF